MKFLLLLLPAIAFFGCAKRELSVDDLEELIPGIQAVKTESIHYAFEGNHAGYFIVLQGRATAESIDQLMASSNHELEPFYEDMVSDYRKWFSMRFRNLRLDSDPDWFQFEPSPVSKKFRLRGSNNWTSEFLYDVIYDPTSGTYWLEGGGM